MDVHTLRCMYECVCVQGKRSCNTNPTLHSPAGSQHGSASLYRWKYTVSPFTLYLLAFGVECKNIESTITGIHRPHFSQHMDNVTKHRLVLAVRKSGFFQVNWAKQSVSLYFLLLALLPHQQYFVTGNSMCASLSFDMEHHERFHSIQKYGLLSPAFCFVYMSVTLPDIFVIYTHMLYTHTYIHPLQREGGPPYIPAACCSIVTTH